MSNFNKTFLLRPTRRMAICGISATIKSSDRLKGSTAETKNMGSPNLFQSS